MLIDADSQCGRHRFAPAPAAPGYPRRQADRADASEEGRALEAARALLDEVLAEYDDALAAVAEAAAERDLGLPCAALGAVQARLDRCSRAVQEALRRLAALGERPFDADHAA